MLEVLDLLDERAVVRPEGMLRVELARHQRALDEDLVRLRRIDLPEAHLAPRGEHEAVQRHVLVGDRLAARLVPVRLYVGALDEVCPGLLDPVGLDARDVAREDARRLLQLARHHPARPALLESRSRPDVELQPARPVVVVAVQRLHAHVADQPREERPMDLLIGAAGDGVVADLQLRGHLAKLAGQVAPLAHAHVREEMLAASTRRACGSISCG